MRLDLLEARQGLLAILLCALASAVSAAPPEGSATWPFSTRWLDKDPEFAGQPNVLLCLTTPEFRIAGTLCSIATRSPVTVQGEQAYLNIEKLCRYAMERDLAVSPHKEWIVSLRNKPEVPFLLIDCKKNLAYPYRSDDRRPSPRNTSPPPPVVRGDSTAEETSRKALDRLKDIDKRLKAIEKTLEDLGTLIQSQERLRRAMEALRKDLLEELQKLRESRKMSCTRSDGSYGGRGEVIVSVGGRALRFLQTRPPSSSVEIGLTEKQAAELLQRVQRESRDPVLPRIFRSVPAVSRTVTEFYLQDRLIDPELYTLLAGGDARRVSYREAEIFVAQLNRACAGSAQFALPTEEQFIVVARTLYDPVADGLKTCPALTGSGADVQVTELLGNVWQLTRSPCEPFGPGGAAPCPEGSYVRKGGTYASANPLECLPEYRSAAPASVAQKDTSFRLVLVE